MAEEHIDKKRKCGDEESMEKDPEVLMHEGRQALDIFDCANAATHFRLAIKHWLARDGCVPILDINDYYRVGAALYFNVYLKDKDYVGQDAASDVEDLKWAFEMVVAAVKIADENQGAIAREKKIDLFNLLAEISFAQGKEENGFEFYRNSTSIFESLCSEGKLQADSELLAMHHRKIAEAYLSHNNDKEAMKELEIALKILLSLRERIRPVYYGSKKVRQSELCGLREMNFCSAGDILLSLDAMNANFLDYDRDFRAYLSRRIQYLEDVLMRMRMNDVMSELAMMKRLKDADEEPLLR